MNLAPTISPDGKFVAFFARRGLFKIDLFVADANTGQVIKKLAGPTRIRTSTPSASSTPPGRGRPTARSSRSSRSSRATTGSPIFDVNSRTVERSITFQASARSRRRVEPGRQVDRLLRSCRRHRAICTCSTSRPARSVSSRTIATRDIQPAWSPDGKTLAFATDRGPGTNFETLKYGPTESRAASTCATGNVR